MVAQVIIVRVDVRVASVTGIGAAGGGRDGRNWAELSQPGCRRLLHDRWIVDVVVVNASRPGVGRKWLPPAQRTGEVLRIIQGVVWDLRVGFLGFGARHWT